MPGIDGWETLRRIRAAGYTGIRLVVVSANAFDKTLDNDVGIPPDDFIFQPVRHTARLDWLEKRLGLPPADALLGHTAESDGRDWLIVMRETSEDAVLLAMADSFKLTAREVEVLYWVVKGDVNRDFGDILGTSPATVKKHLERIHVKLGVETRTAAGLAMMKVQQLHPMTGSALP